MQGDDGVVGEEGALAGDRAEAEPDVLGGVLHRCRGDEEAVVDAREQRAMRASTEVGLELGQSDEDEREQRLRVPLVVHQDVQVSERTTLDSCISCHERRGANRRSSSAQRSSSR